MQSAGGGEHSCLAGRESDTNKVLARHNQRRFTVRGDFDDAAPSVQGSGDVEIALGVEGKSLEIKSLEIKQERREDAAQEQQHQAATLQPPPRPDAPGHSRPIDAEEPREEHPHQQAQRPSIADRGL